GSNSGAEAQSDKRSGPRKGAGPRCTLTSVSRLAPAITPAITLWGRARTLIGQVAGSSPPRTALVIFAVVIAAFTALLMMPWASASNRAAPFHDALFVASSAVSVTGLTPVSTAEHWSLAGQIVILAGIQVGGLGILTLASLVAVSVTRHLGVRTRLVAQEGIASGPLGEVGSLIRTVIICSAVIEA